MEKKTMEALRTMVCGELDDIAKKGILSHEDLDILKDLLESAKNLEKIEKYQSEKEEKHMDMDRGYSQRKYYIDADYNPYRPSNSYAPRGGRPIYDMGRSYDSGADYMDGNSYIYYEPPYPKRGYSMASKPEMITELTKMMAETTDESVRKAITEAINTIK